MTVHVKWSSGDQIWYDGSQTILTVKNKSQGLEVGEDSSGVPFKFFGNTASAFMNWDSVNDELVFDLADIAMGDTDYVMFGDDDDITMAWDATQFVILPVSSGYNMNIGSAAKPLNVINYGNINYRTPNAPAASCGELILTSSAGGSNRIQFIDPLTTGGVDKTVTLPAETGSCGVVFTIFNTAGYPVGIGDTSGGGLDVTNSTASTIVKITEHGGAIVACDGVTWVGMQGTYISSS